MSLSLWQRKSTFLYCRPKQNGLYKITLSSLSSHALSGQEWCRMQFLLRLLWSSFSYKRNEFILIKELTTFVIFSMPPLQDASIYNSMMAGQRVILPLLYNITTGTKCFYYHINVGEWCRVKGKSDFSSTLWSSDICHIRYAHLHLHSPLSKTKWIQECTACSAGWAQLTKSHPKLLTLGMEDLCLHTVPTAGNFGDGAHTAALPQHCSFN